MDGDQFPFDQFLAGGGAVPEVDPADLECVLELCGGVHPSDDQPKATGFSMCEQGCSPGADVLSVCYRAGMLQLLGGPLSLLSPWLHDGVLDKAVIKVAAKFPMEKVEAGVVRHSLPFDLEEFVKQVKAAAVE
jgi:hypothetical protein